MNFKVKTLAVAIVLTSVIGSSMIQIEADTRSPNEITLNPNVTYQTFTNWEAQSYAADWPGHSSAYPSYVDELFDRMDSEFGVNRLAIQVHSGHENPVDYGKKYLDGEITEEEYAADPGYIYEIVNDNNDPFVIDPNGFHFTLTDHQIDEIVLPMKERIEARGETLQLNVCYVDFEDPPTSKIEHYNYPEEYAEFVLATYLHLDEKYGLLPTAWEVILEPDNTVWNGTLIGNALLRAADRLISNGFTPRFRLPSTTNMARVVPYFDEVVNTVGTQFVLDYFEEISYHSYEENNNQNRQDIFSKADQFGLTTSMTEWMWADHHDLHYDLKVAKNSVWGGHGIAGKYPDFDFYRIDDSDPNNPVIILNDNAKFWRQYIKFIHDGAVQIDAATNNNNYDPVSFINTDGGYVVVIKAAIGGTFDVIGLPAGTYGIKYTTSTSYDVDLADIVLSDGQTLSTFIPQAGVLTVYAKNQPQTKVPSKPRNPQAESGYDYIDLSWQEPENDGGMPILNYSIYKYSTITNETEIISIDPSLRSYNDSYLTKGVTYFYNITAINAVGESNHSDDVNATPLSPPSQPIDIVVLSRDGFLILQWGMPIDDGGDVIFLYQIYRGLDQEYFSLLASVNSSNYEYNDTQVEDDTRYYYLVSAVNSVGESDGSEVVSAIPMGLPSPPKDLAITYGDGFVNLNWKMPKDDGGSNIDYFVLYRGTESGLEDPLKSIDAQYTFYNDSGLINGQIYYYYVIAVNSKGESNPSNEVSATPQSRPATPEINRIFAGNTYVFLQWNIPMNDNAFSVDEVRIYRGVAPNTGILIDSVQGDLDIYNDTAVENGIMYYYFLTAVNEIGESEKSAEVEARPLGLPTPPQNLKAQVLDDHIYLSWDAPKNDGGAEIVKYYIYRGLTPDDMELLKKVKGSTTNYRDEDIELDKKYYYYVVAVNEVGTSSPSDENSAISLKEISNENKGNSFLGILFIMIFLILLLMIIITLFLRRQNTNNP
jgi:fibronectin type 3 domain-containing protein